MNLWWDFITMRHNDDSAMSFHLLLSYSDTYIKGLWVFSYSWTLPGTLALSSEANVHVHGWAEEGQHTYSQYISNTVYVGLFSMYVR